MEYTPEQTKALEKMCIGLYEWWSGHTKDLEYDRILSMVGALDQALVKVMLPIAKQGLFKDGPLQALAMYSYSWFLQRKEPWETSAGVMVGRLMESDLYLDLHRRYEAGMGDVEWVNGKRVKRKYPLYGFEFLHQLDSGLKAKEYIRLELVKRKLIRE